MDFNSLGAGSPFYILQKSEKPTLQIGSVKSKSEPKSPYQVGQPAIFNGLNAMSGQGLVVDIVVSVDGSDIPFNNLPFNAEHTSYNNGATFVSSTREATLQAVDGMIQASKKVLEQVDYHKSVLTEGEKMLETLNPRYAEEKQRDRSIKSLEERQTATDRKLDSILAILQKLDSPAPKAKS